MRKKEIIQIVEASLLGFQERLSSAKEKRKSQTEKVKKWKLLQIERLKSGTPAARFPSRTR